MDIRGRRIAFDYGSVRIGVAICDPDGILATPLPHLLSTHPKLQSQISLLFDEYQPIEIFLGYPLHLSGEAGSAVLLVENFKSVLSQLTAVPITFIDERMTTLGAAKSLREAGMSSIESKSLIDSMSAVAILEQGLRSEKR